MKDIFIFLQITLLLTCDCFSFFFRHRILKCNKNTYIKYFYFHITIIVHVINQTILERYQKGDNDNIM